MSIELIDLDPDSGEEPESSTVRRGSPRQGLLILVVVVLAVAGAMLVTSPDEPPAHDAQSTTTTTPVETKPAPTGGAQPTVPTSLAFEALADPPALDVTVAVSGTGPDGVAEMQFWSLGLATGVAQRVPLGPDAAELTIADVRFFGAHRAVAVLGGGNYATLDVGADAITVDRVVDIGTRLSFGAEALTPDGRFAWVGIPAGLIRWRLADDQVDERWIDNFGDLTVLPQVKGIVDSGLVVEGSGRTFLISDGDALDLELAGEVVESGANWVVVRSCDARLRCGQLTFNELGTGASVTMPQEYRFRSICGLATAAADGSTLRVVAQNLGSLVVLSVTGDGAVTETDLHPTGIGCVDATESEDGLLVVAHDRALSLLDLSGEAPAEAELVRLERLRPILAVGVSPS